MTESQRKRLLLSLPFAICAAALAYAVAAPQPNAGDAGPVLYVAGHVMGLGEQQVYVIDRASRLTVRYRDPLGTLRAKTFVYHAQTSVAWTIEDVASGGEAVVAVTTAAPTSAGSAASANVETGAAAQAAPSPRLDARGASGVGAGSGLAEVAPLSVVLSGIGDAVPDIGKGWRSSGAMRLAYGTLRIELDNVVARTAGDLSSVVAQIASRGQAGFSATVNVSGFGVARLRGGGSASATSYLETQNKLPLGIRLDASSSGNATAGPRHGRYELIASTTIALVKYVPGRPPVVLAPGYVPGSAFMGGLMTPDTQIFSTVPPNTIAIPAPTDTGYVGPPAYATPYQSAFPEMSLPPIPLPVASDRALASPPAGPSPTPRPTHY